MKYREEEIWSVNNLLKMERYCRALSLYLVYVYLVDEIKMASFTG